MLGLGRVLHVSGADRGPMQAIAAQTVCSPLERVRTSAFEYTSARRGSWVTVPRNCGFVADCFDYATVPYSFRRVDWLGRSTRGFLMHHALSPPSLSLRQLDLGGVAIKTQYQEALTRGEVRVTIQPRCARVPTRTTALRQSAHRESGKARSMGTFLGSSVRR